MIGAEAAGGPGAFAAVRSLIRTRPALERCELCGSVLAGEHQHLLEVGPRRLLCACPACSLLFPEQAGSKYARVPRTIRVLTEFAISDAQWEDLRLPIDLAFFSRNSTLNRVVALYPSPAGPTESLLPLETWTEIARQHPLVAGMQADVEALLVNRVGHARGDRQAEYFVVPIDECFKLVGLIRLHWKGLSGGTSVWTEIARFFEDLETRAVRG